MTNISNIERIIKSGTGTRFAINSSFHAGRTYRIISRSADKFGSTILICEWLEQRGYKSQQIITAAELQSAIMVSQ